MADKLKRIIIPSIMDAEIEGGGDVNVQSDWNQTDSTADDYIKNKPDIYTKNEIDQKLVGAMTYKGTKATVAELPNSGNQQGDVWHITADGSEWAWNGSSWEELGKDGDAVLYTEQTLTPAQQEQARENIGVRQLPTVTASDNGKVLGVVNGEWAVKPDDGGSSVTVDSALSTTSTNPVQNKVVKAALDAKADASALAAKQDTLTAGQNVTISGNTISANVDSAEIASNVTDWLDANVNPVGSAVVVDSSLSVSGAAADSKAVGDRFDEFFEYEPSEPSYNLLNMNDPDVQNGYAFSKTGAISAEIGKSITGFIPITAGQWYCFHYEQSKNVSGTSNGVYIVLYDANKSYIDYWRPAGTESRIRSGTDANGHKYVAFQMGSSASYFRYTVDTADANSFYMLVNSETMPNKYMPYGGESGRKALREDVEIPDSVLPEGISDAVKTALLACFRGVGWTSPEWQTLYNALYAALYGLDPSEPSLLPAEYQEVEWIGSTGTQLLEVGISFSSNAQADYEMEAEIAVPEANASTAILMCTSAEGGYYIANVSSGSAIGVSSSIVFSNLDVTQKHKYVLQWDANSVIATCEGQSITRARATQQIAKPSFFGDYENLYRSKCRIYSAKVKQTGSYVRNLIPCYRKLDGVIGMFDIVGNVFYTNSGTGTFTKGANV